MFMDNRSLCLQIKQIMSVWVCGVSTDCAIRVLREKDTLGVRKFIRTGLITGSDLCLSYLQLFFA